MKRVASLFGIIGCAFAIYCALWKGWDAEGYSFVSLCFIIHYGEHLIDFIEHNQDK